MQRLDIDLKKNPEVADAVADLEPGATVTLRTSIVKRDDQTLTLELEEAVVPAEGAEEETEEKEEGEPQSAAEAVARGLDE